MSDKQQHSYALVLADQALDGRLENIKDTPAERVLLACQEYSLIDEAIPETWGDADGEPLSCIVTSLVDRVQVLEHQLEIVAAAARREALAEAEAVIERRTAEAQRWALNAVRAIPRWDGSTPFTKATVARI